MSSSDSIHPASTMPAQGPVPHVDAARPEARGATGDANACDGVIAEIARPLTTQLVNPGGSVSLSNNVLMNEVRREGVLPYMYDLRSLPVVQMFSFTSEIDSYVNYQPGIIRMQQNVMMRYNYNDEAIYEPSMRVFAENVVWVRHSINKDFFASRASGLRFVESVPLSYDGVVSTGSLNPEAGYTQYFNGLMCLLVTIMADDRVLYNVPQINCHDAGRASYMRSEIPAQSSASPVMAARYSPVDWFRNFITRTLADQTIRFAYGRTDTLCDPETKAKLVDYIAFNTDQFYSAVVNLNAQYLVSDTDIQSRITQMVRAYAFPLVLLDFNAYSAITPYNCFRPSVAARVLFFSAFLHPDFSSMVIADNLKYFDSVNIFSYETNMTLAFYNRRDTAIGQTLMTYLINRVEACDFMYVNYMMALEISPVFTYFEAIVQGHTINTLEEAVVMLVEIYLFQLTFPNCFDRVKGVIQRDLFRCFDILCLREVGDFISAKGQYYRLTDQGKQFPARGVTCANYCNSEYYMSGVYPSLFGSMDGVTGVIPNIMNAMQPIGEQLADSAAQAAGFPRLAHEPAHYIPFKYDKLGVSTEFSRSVNGFIDVLIRSIISYRRTQDVGRSATAYSSCHAFLTSLLQHFDKFDHTMCTILPLHFRSRANTMFNIGDSFPGTYLNDTRVDYVLLSDGAISYNLYRREGNTREWYHRINTAMIWQIYAKGSSYLMRKVGATGEGIAHPAVDERFVVPDESEHLARAFTIYNNLERSMLPLSLATIVFSDQLLSDVPEKIMLRNLILAPKVSAGVRTATYKAAAAQLGVSSESVGAVYRTPASVVDKSPVCINPEMRRVEPRTKAVLEFDANIDNEYIRDVICPISDIALSRLRVGLSFAIRSPFLRIRTGLRLANRPSVNRDPNRLLTPPADMRIVKYDQLQFVIKNIDGVPIYMLLFEGREYLNEDEWPLLNVVIDDQQKVLHHHAYQLIKGIDRKKFIVDVTKQAFIPVLDATLAPTRYLLEQILIEGCDRILTVPFTDSAGAFNIPGIRPSGREEYTQYVFPLHSIATDYFIGSLSDPDSAVVPSSIITPNKKTMDTGHMRSDGIPVYTDMSSKVDSPFVSMSNVLSTYTTNIQYNQSLQYSRQTPQTLFESACVRF